MEWFAHSRNPAGHWHRLADHLANTAALARSFGEPFGAGDLSEAVGWLHDVGKCSDVFQSYLRVCDRDGWIAGRRAFPHRDHKSAGARLASGLGAGQVAPLLGMTILGHHGGVPDLAQGRQVLAEAPEIGDATGSDLELPSLEVLNRPAWLDEKVPDTADGWRLLQDIEMYVRFIFSTLVDADWLDTEAHFSPDLAAQRRRNRQLDLLWDRFVARRDKLCAEASKTDLNRVRSEIYSEVLDTTSVPPGLYQVATPTGSGKTLLGLGWALEHARANGLRRVVTAVPYISVTDQVATVYREMLDDEDDAVLEHHSEVIEGGRWQRLAAENWDAPVVVTTTVRLFESLFSNRPSACRRLHRLAGSVVVLDEVQALPIEVLDPIVDALRSLVTRLGATVLLMTATQPTLHHVPSSGGAKAVDLLQSAERFAPHFKRTTRRHAGRVSHAEVAAMVADHEQCLCIVNSISDAVTITEKLRDREVLHLTTRLRPSDRRDRLVEIRQRLAKGLPCRAVSTQLVEAGVDVDFPVVLRAFAPLPSLLQADGRCNRNGLLPGLGETIVFELTGGRAPTGSCYYGPGLAQTLVTFAEEAGPDPWSSAGVEEWYRRLFGDPLVHLDAKGVQQARRFFNYKTTAELFRMIDDDSVSIVVPWLEDDPRTPQLSSAIAQLRAGDPIERGSLRLLQDATVPLRRRLAEQCCTAGLAEPLGDSNRMVWHGAYDDQLGLVTTADAKEVLIW
ncbi:MAG: CRISPR-associated helicase Cas3' [Actinomycetota bacterium]|nr:CRISPR-associated helicase Cas3' [Actinomycetota bacterium]